MFAVIFEVQPKLERWNDYLDTARLLRPELERIEGFIDNERFRSQRTEGRILSLSTWQDEKALIRWRTQATHYTQGQVRGRAEIFADYHLRVGEVTADTRPPDGVALREQRFDATEVGAAKAAAIVELAPGKAEASAFRAPVDGTPGLVDDEWFESITEEGKRLLLTSWTTAERAAAWSAQVMGADVRVRQVRIVRDYGMLDRREAPQYFPAVDRSQ
jgi:heme-degrading monooxygenase HmoA